MKRKRRLNHTPILCLMVFMICGAILFTLFSAHKKVRERQKNDTLSFENPVEEATTTIYDGITLPETEIVTETPITENYTGKILVNELSELQVDTAKAIVRKLIMEYYAEGIPDFVEPKMDYSMRRSNVIENETIKNQIKYYAKNSATPETYDGMEDEGIYCSITGLTENDYIFFEMDNAHFAISEPYSNITDYNSKYPFLFTIRNSDNTTAYYWDAKEANDLVEYPSHRVIRVWMFNTADNTFSYLQ